MGDTLKVTVAGLRALSQTCTEQAGQLMASPASPVAAASWQTSGAGVGTVNARGGTVTGVMSERLTANAAKFNAAADDYQTQDEHSAVKLSESDFTAAGGAGGDGGAGGLPTSPPVPVAAGAGGDGGAGGS